MSWEDYHYNIPLIDFAPISESDQVDFSTESVRTICNELCKAFQNIGFVYLKNSGISDGQVHQINVLGSSFFHSDVTVKEKYRRYPSSKVGWGGMGAERADPSGQPDLKEMYDIIPWMLECWPDDIVPGFKQGVENFFKDCTKLAFSVLDAMSVGLQLETVDTLRNFHQIEADKTHTALRLLYYPPVEDVTVKDGQERLGEHSDFGSITLLFQDNIGGLEVECADGVYRPATPIPGTVLVNIGDMMQRWTSDKLKSNKHRVLIPKEAVKRRQTRQSVAFFVNATDDCIIECLDGSNKYPPIKAKDYLYHRINKSFY